MPIKQNIIIISPDDGDEYEYRGRQFRNRRTGRIATVKVRIGLEQVVIAKGLTYGDSVYQDLINFGIEQGHVPERSRESIEFMRKIARESRVPTSNMRTGLLSEAAFIEMKDPLPGSMICFFYDAKWKKELKYWDAFPVDFVLETYRNGYLGLNLHYLPYRQRGILMDALYRVRRINEGGKRERLYLDYAELVSNIKKYKGFQPCIKRYLFTHVKSRILEIPARGWSVVSFLPVQQFQKATQTVVWQDSIDMMNKWK